MAHTKNLNITEETEIMVLEFLRIDPGEPISKNDAFAHFFCKVRWAEPGIEDHVIKLDFDSDLQSTDEIWVEDYSISHLVPGKYKLIKDIRKPLLFEKM